MIKEINGWRTHPPTNIAMGQYSRGPSEMFVTLAWKPRGYDRLGELNRFRRTAGLKAVGDRSAILRTDPEYGSPGFYAMVNMNGHPTTIFLSDNRDQGALFRALCKTSPEHLVNKHISDTHPEKA